MNLRRADLRYLLPTLVVCTGLYLATISSSVSMVDTGLFMMVCDANGIAHPPGYPLATLICHPMMSLPFDGAIPGNLFSVLFGVLTLCVVYLLCRLIQLSELESALVIAVLAVSLAYWSQSIVLEVYTLNTFVFVCMMICCLSFHQTGNGRWLTLGAFFLGLGFSNHWPLIVASCLCLVPFLLWKIKPLLNVLKNPLLLLACLAALLLGVSPYLLMFTKSGNGMTMIGEVHTFSDLWLYASRETFQDSSVDRPAGWLGLLWWVPFASIWQFGYLGLLLVPLGMFRSAFDLARPVAVSLCLLWAANCIALPLLNNAQFNELSRTYYPTWILLAYVSCAIWFVLGIRYLWVVLQSQAVIRVSTAVLVFLVVTVQSYRSLGADDTDWVERYNRLLLGSLEENAVLVVAGDTETGPLGSLHYVHGVRPDIELRQRHNMLFGNRLANPRISIDEQAQLLASYLESTHRPVYSIGVPDEPARDYGMYFKDGEVGFGFDPVLDDFMSDLINALAEEAIREPFIKAYLQNMLHQYARAVVGDAVESEGLSGEQLARVGLVSQTFQGKIWTLHHLVNSRQPSIDHELLAELIIAGERHLESGSPPNASRQFLLLAGDAYLKVLGEQAQAISSYRRAREFDVDRETCEHLGDQKQLAMLAEVGCAD